MPLYIKSPINSQCNISARRSTILDLTSPPEGRAGLETRETAARTPELLRFAKVRTGRRKVLEMLLKAPDPVTSQTGRSRESSCPASSTALTKSKVSVSALKGLVMDVKPVTTPQKVASQPICSRNEAPPIFDVTRKCPPDSESLQMMSPRRQLQSTNPDPLDQEVDKEAIIEAVALLQASAHALFRKMELHPETLRQITEWQAASPQSPPGRGGSEQHLVLPGSTEHKLCPPALSKRISIAAVPATKLDLTTQKPRPRPSTSSYFPNASTTIPCRRAYNYVGCSSTGVGFNEPAVTPSTPQFLFGIRESLSNISMVPFVSSTCASDLSSPRDSSHSDFEESDISDIQITNCRSKHHLLKKKLGTRTSLPAIRSKMKKLMRTLSDMNAVPEVMDIFIENLPPVFKMSPDHVQGPQNPPPALRELKVATRRSPRTGHDLPAKGVRDEDDGGDKGTGKMNKPRTEPIIMAAKRSSRVLREDKSEGLLPTPGFALRPGTRLGMTSGIPRRTGSFHVNASTSVHSSISKTKNSLGTKKSVDLDGNPSSPSRKSKVESLKPKK